MARHAHDHGTANANRARLGVALAVTGSVLVLELVTATLTGSLALLVDAAHMLTDSMGLVVALVSAALMSRPPSQRRTWGWARAEVVSAAAQASLLLVVGCYAVWEGISRLVDPPPVESQGLAIVGVVGLLANLVSLAVLSGGRGHNLNMRAAFLEVANDALGSVAVLVAAAVIAWTGWQRADAIAGLFVALLILPRAASLLGASGRILLEATPEGLDLGQVREHMLSQPHVADVHDLHSSLVASGLPTLTAHVVLDDGCFADGHGQEILRNLQECLASHHGLSIEHSTLQLEGQLVAAGHRENLHE